MKQEEKDLLLKDLCARLPYGIRVAIECSKGKYTRIYDLREIDNDTTSELRQQVKVWDHGFYTSVISYPLIDCRPYLRSMSSMTDEEKKEMHNLLSPEGTAIYENDGIAIPINHYGEFVPYEFMNRIIQYLLKHHFDFMGLIPKGLAIEVIKENNPY